MENAERLTYYLDTSAINHLYADAKWDDAAFAVLLQVAAVRFSALNIAELCATQDADKRVRLMCVVQKLSDDYRPLALPSEILKRSLEFFEEVRISTEKGSPPPDNTRNLSVEGDESAFYALVNDPELARDDEVRRDMVALKTDQEQRFRSLHDSIRPDFQRLRRKIGDPYRTGAGLIKYFRGPFDTDEMEESFRETFSDIAERMGVSYGGNPHEVFNRLEPWSFFFGAMIHALYNRVFAPTKYGSRTNPGAIDTKQAIYLTACNRFVTADLQSRQYRAIRVVNKLGLKSRRVLRYDEFGPMLL